MLRSLNMKGGWQLRRGTNDVDPVAYHTCAFQSQTLIAAPRIPRQETDDDNGHQQGDDSPPGMAVGFDQFASCVSIEHILPCCSMRRVFV